MSSVSCLCVSPALPIASLAWSGIKNGMHMKSGATDRI